MKKPNYNSFALEGKRACKSAYKIMEIVNKLIDPDGGFTLEYSCEKNCTNKIALVCETDITILFWLLISKKWIEEQE